MNTITLDNFNTLDNIKEIYPEALYSLIKASELNTLTETQKKNLLLDTVLVLNGETLRILIKE